jgi:succinoglycan biosynthesis protein ExoL
MKSRIGKVLFLLQIIGHPRDSKRIKMLQDQGFSVEALGFDRAYRGGRVPSCPLSLLGVVRNGNYLARVIKLLWAIPKVRAAISRCDVVYASGQDMGFLAQIAGIGLGKPIVLEVGDLVNLQTKSGLVGTLFRSCDQWVTSRYRLLVVVSEGFLANYYQGLLDTRTRALIIENKLEGIGAERPQAFVALPEPAAGPLVGRPLRIGYFGIVRDAWSWEVLTGLVARHPTRFEVVVAGPITLPPGLSARVAQTPQMTYLGEYQSPRDLQKIYAQVDMVWACYPPMRSDDLNYRSGRPNRFYESCYFKRPCFARRGCSFAVDVQRYGIGCLIDSNSVEDTISCIAGLSPSDFSRWRQAMDSVPLSLFLAADEARLLSEEMRHLIRI